MEKKRRDVVLFRIWTYHVIPRDRLYKKTWRGTDGCVLINGSKDVTDLIESIPLPGGLIGSLSKPRRRHPK